MASRQFVDRSQLIGLPSRSSTQRQQYLLVYSSQEIHPSRFNGPTPTQPCFCPTTRPIPPSHRYYEWSQNGSYRAPYVLVAGMNDIKGKGSREFNRRGGA